MEATKQIALDMLAVGIPPAVEAKQNDTARVIGANLYAGGNVFDVPVGAIAVFRYRKPDGTAGFYDALPDDTPAISIERNVVTILLVEQVLTVPGDVQCEINLYNTAGEKLTTFTFCLRVQASVLTDAEIISSDYFNVLSEKVAQALQAAADAAASAQEAKDAAASINPGTYMQKTMYDPENKQKPYIPADEALSLESYGGSAVGVVSKADEAAACTGNAATAIKLATARMIGSASFDGSGDITLAQMGAATAAQGEKADAAMPKSGGTFTGGITAAGIASTGALRLATQLLFSNQTTNYGAAADAATGYTSIWGLAGLKVVLPNGSTLAPVLASNVSGSSSRRYKRNIADMTAATAALLLQLRPVAFEYNEELNDPGQKYGLIAEELAEIDPTCVYRDGEGRVEGINYTMLAPQLIKLCQIQQAQIDALAARLAALEAL